jgi:hypothetical protein
MAGSLVGDLEKYCDNAEKVLKEPTRQSRATSTARPVFPGVTRIEKEQMASPAPDPAPAPTVAPAEKRVDPHFHLLIEGER